MPPQHTLELERRRRITEHALRATRLLPLPYFSGKGSLLSRHGSSIRSQDSPRDFRLVELPAALRSRFTISAISGTRGEWISHTPGPTSFGYLKSAKASRSRSNSRSNLPRPSCATEKPHGSEARVIRAICEPPIYLRQKRAEDRAHPIAYPAMRRQRNVFGTEDHCRPICCSEHSCCQSGHPAPKDKLMEDGRSSRALFNSAPARVTSKCNTSTGGTVELRLEGYRSSKAED